MIKASTLGVLVPRSLLLYLCGLLVGGCASRGLNDFTLADIQVVSPSGDAVPGLAPDIGGRTASPKGGIPILRIDISSGVNLVELRRKNGYHISAEIVSCQTQPAVVHVGGDYVYWHGYSVNLKENEFKDYPSLVTELSEKTLTTYSVYAPTARQAVVAGPLASPAFDLRVKPFDLCLTIHGGDMLGRHIVSNVITVPGGLIGSAFQAFRP